MKIADKLKEYKAENIVVDPVMVATSGAKLISEEAIGTLKNIFFNCKCSDTKIFRGRSSVAEMEIRRGHYDQGLQRKRVIHTIAQFLCGSGRKLNDANDLLYRDGDYRWFKAESVLIIRIHMEPAAHFPIIKSTWHKRFDMDTSVERAQRCISGALAAMLDLSERQRVRWITDLQLKMNIRMRKRGKTADERKEKFI